MACLQCADSLDGKRRDSLFCSSKCQHRFRRSHTPLPNPKQDDYSRHEPIACVSACMVDAGGAQSIHVGGD
jgi:hypothetical protein